MKDKILMLIVGILIGAIITTGVFLVIDKNQQKTQQNQQNQRMQQFQNMMGDPNSMGGRRFRGGYGNNIGPGGPANTTTDTTQPATTGNSV